MDRDEEFFEELLEGEFEFNTESQLYNALDISPAVAFDDEIPFLNSKDIAKNTPVIPKIKTWENESVIGRIIKKDNPDYYVEISIKIYNDKRYIVFLKHRPWKKQDKSLALPLEFAAGFFKLFRAFDRWPLDCITRIGVSKH